MYSVLPLTKLSWPLLFTVVRSGVALAFLLGQGNPSLSLVTSCYLFALRRYIPTAAITIVIFWEPPGPLTAPCFLAPTS
jgi:hypothetical protein